MDHKEDDTRNSNHFFHPLQFALWALVIIIISIFGIHYYLNPFSLASLFSNAPTYTLLSEAEQAPWQTLTVKPKETLFTLLKRAGVSSGDYYKTIALQNAQSLLAQLKPNQHIYVLTTPDHTLEKLIYKNSDTQYLEIIYPKNAPPTATIITQQVSTKLKSANGIIQSSLSEAASTANISDNLIAEFTNIFSWDIDFSHQVQAGDKFIIIYSQPYIDGKASPSANILAAEFITHQKKYIAIQYQNSDSSIGYYTPTGENLAKTFLRTPLNYKYVSSPFNSNRMHPILHIVRPHEGVDLAAPTGTPIKASGNGIITFRGRKGGYGNAIIIQHGEHYSSLYAHMSKFSPHFHTRSPVKKGQVIGYVGHTGLADGAHLHYEFRIDGVHYDPMTVKLPQAQPIPTSEKTAFLAYANKMITQLNNISG